MKPIAPGTPFEVPLPDGTFAYGYVTFWGYDVGVLCVLMNIFDFRSDEPGAYKAAFDAPVLIRDLLNEASHFRRTKFNTANNTYWTLRRNKCVPKPMTPKYGFVFGTGVQALDGTVEMRTPTDAEQYQFPRKALLSGEFYPLYILGQMTDRHVVLIEKVKDADGKMISPARFELRADDALNGLKPYGFAGAADTLIPHQ